MHSRFISTLLGLAAGVLFNTAQAQVAAPSQGGEVSVVNVTATTMELEFGTTGTGQGRVVAMAATDEGMPVPLAATDGRFYTASVTYGQGSVLGRGFAVYNGTGHSTTITGLKSGTHYYITSAEYNTDGSTIAYNTRSSSVSTATQNAAPSPLPVELTAFTGTVDAHGMAQLRWATASEHQSDYFAIERSADGIAFAEAGRVAAAGTSSQSRSYQWADPQRLLRTTYYRLRQADRDGTVHYSAVVSLAPLPRLVRTLEVYPNPSAGQSLQLSAENFDGEVINMRITDVLGRQLLTETLTPRDAHFLTPLPLPAGLTPGTYVLTLGSSSGPVQKRFVVSE